MPHGNCAVSIMIRNVCHVLPGIGNGYPYWEYKISNRKGLGMKCFRSVTITISHNYEAARVSTWFMSNYIFFWSLIMVHVRTTQPFQNSPEGPSLHEYPFGLCIFWIVEFQIHRRDLPFSVTRLVPLNWYENTMKRRAHESLLSRYSSRKLGRIYNHYSGWWHLTMGSSLSGTVHAYSTKVKSDETAYIKTRVGYPFASSPNNLVDSGPKA